MRRAAVYEHNVQYFTETVRGIDYLYFVDSFGSYGPLRALGLFSSGQTPVLGIPEILTALT